MILPIFYKLRGICFQLKLQCVYIQPHFSLCKQSRLINQFKQICKQCTVTVKHKNIFNPTFLFQVCRWICEPYDESCKQCYGARPQFHLMYHWQSGQNKQQVLSFHAQVLLRLFLYDFKWVLFLQIFPALLCHLI